MLVAGIIITSIAVMMILFPQFFLLLKNPKISHESLKSTKVKNAFSQRKDLAKKVEIVCLDTPTFSASCSCERFAFFLSS